MNEKTTCTTQAKEVPKRVRKPESPAAKAARALRHKAWSEKNKEKLSENFRKYRELHKEELDKKRNANRNVEKDREAQKRYYYAKKAEKIMRDALAPPNDEIE